MAQTFIWKWSNGVTTEVPLSDQTYFDCSFTQPDSDMQQSVASIVLHSGDGENLNEQEQYILSASGTIDGIIGYSTLIRDQWDAIENDCHHWNNWFRYCSNKPRFCNMTENQLESAEDRWRALVTSQVNSKANLLNRLQEIRDQIGYDHQQGIDQATLDQMIAETNNLISITAYNNESRELDVASRKSKELFAPIMIGVILLGMGFYLLKK